MKKILTRAGMAPYESFDASQIILDNLIGDNTGNLIYLNGFYRALTTDRQELIPNRYRLRKSIHADFINESYDAYVMPFADAFRQDMIGTINDLTRLIRKLTIPVVIVGIGLRAPLDADVRHSFPFDEDVKEFIKAVLDHSAKVGIRGEITASYLKRLGFREELDFTVIGCPSMYTNGSQLTVKQPELTSGSRISINASVVAPNHVNQFLRNVMKEVPDYYFLPQRLQELKMTFAGEPYVHQQRHAKDYPDSMLDQVYRENRVRCFLNAKTWFDFLKDVDLSIGGRLHGNIAAIIAGTPALLIPHDSRMKELTEFHNLPHVWAKDLQANQDLFELVEKIDFKSILKNHDRNFQGYLKFLEENELDHIFKDGKNPRKAPLDLKVDSIQLEKPIDTLNGHTYEENIKRVDQYYREREKREKQLITELKDLKKAYYRECKESQYRKELLGSKPVKYAVSLRKLLKK